MTIRTDKYDYSLRLLPIVLTVLILFPVIAYGQADRKFIRQGNREYRKAKYAESEISYRKSVDKNKESADAVFNTGDALYKQKKYDESAKEFANSFKMNEYPEKKSVSLYNMGNSLLMANKVQESIDAYKNSLKLNPDNVDAKYNLAYAQDLLKKQEQQKQQQQQNDQNKDNKKNQDKQPQKDQNKDNQDKQQQNDRKDARDDKNQQQQQQVMSKDDAQRVLDAVANDEKNVQEKVKLAKAAKGKVRAVKNW